MEVAYFTLSDKQLCQFRQIIGGAKGYSAPPPPPQNYWGGGGASPCCLPPLSYAYAYFGWWFSTWSKCPMGCKKAVSVTFLDNMCEHCPQVVNIPINKGNFKLLTWYLLMYHPLWIESRRYTRSAKRVMTKGDWRAGEPAGGHAGIRIWKILSLFSYTLLLD